MFEIQEYTHTHTHTHTYVGHTLEFVSMAALLLLI